MLVKKELGRKVTLIYLTGISVVSLFMGLLLDWGLANYSLQIDTSMQHQHNVVPYELSLLAAIFLIVLAIPATRNRIMPFVAK